MSERELPVVAKRNDREETVSAVQTETSVPMEKQTGETSADENQQKPFPVDEGDFEKQQEEQEPPQSIDPRAKFHFKDSNNKITVYDYAIFQYIKKEIPMFVLGNEISVYENGVYLSEDSDATLKTIIRDCIYSYLRKAPTINRVYELFLQDKALRKSYDQLNNYPDTWINFNNGMYDVKTGIFYEHDPVYYAINQVPHSYDPKAKPKGDHIEKWLDFICEAEDDREMLLQFAGLAMTKDKSQQKFLILNGEGGTGKSTLIKLINKMVGKNNISHVSLDELMEDKFASIDLLGKLLNSCGDLEIDALEKTKQLKIVTGEDGARGQKKYHNAINFDSYCKLLFAANQLPIIKGEFTGAVYRRMLILRINKVPEKTDPDFFQKLEQEMDYFIHLAVDALHRMYISETGRITESESSKRAVEKLRQDSDSVQAFLDDETISLPGNREKREDAYFAYEKYCRNEKRTALTRNLFYRSMRAKRSEVKSNGQYYFQGILIRKACPKPALDCPKLPLEVPPGGFGIPF